MAVFAEQPMLVSLNKELAGLNSYGSWAYWMSETKIINNTIQRITNGYPPRGGNPTVRDSA